MPPQDGHWGRGCGLQGLRAERLGHCHCQCVQVCYSRAGKGRSPALRTTHPALGGMPLVQRLG